MDLLFLEEFASSPEFLNIFLSKIGLENANIIEVEQSKVDMEYGESDMTLIVEKDNKKHGILIENKIDAIAMPNQYGRYVERGKIGIKTVIMMISLSLLLLQANIFPPMMNPKSIPTVYPMKNALNISNQKLMHAHHLKLSI